MTTQELRIGNWLFFTTDYHNEEGQVTSIDTLHVTYGERQEVDIELCSGIPLSEEWLLKAGFEHLYGGEYQKDVGSGAGRIDISLSSGIAFIHSGLSSSAESYGFAVKILYVHQLQNLYFSLTCEELTP